MYKTKMQEYVQNSLNDLQLPPGSKNMHFFQTNRVKKIVIIKMI